MCACGHVSDHPSSDTGAKAGEATAAAPKSAAAALLERALYFIFVGWLLVVAGVGTILWPFSVQTSVDVRIPCSDPMLSMPRP